MGIKSASINCFKQTGFKNDKQKQIENFIKKNEIDIVHLQEINIDSDTFEECTFITSYYQIISNNALPASHNEYFCF